VSQKKLSGIIYAVLLVVCLVVLAYFIGTNHASKQVQVVVEKADHVERREKNSTSSNDEKKGLLDLNEATKSQLEELPGIGSTLAERILAYREMLGGFVTKEQLLEVEGIGEQKYVELETLVTVGVK